MTEEQVRDHIVSEFEVEETELEGFEILIAAELSESYESSNWFLLRKEGRLYENHGGHCSCNGYEEQWGPEETNTEYLHSDKFHVPIYSYSDDEDTYKGQIVGEIARLYPQRPMTNRRGAIAAQKARGKNPYIVTEE
jgi:hypothetical protein